MTLAELQAQLRTMTAARDAWTALAALPDAPTADADALHERTPMDTLGSLVDKLVTVDMKMWHNQEALYAIRRMEADDFAQRYGHDLVGLHAIVKRCCDLNVQRARLMDEIDKAFAEATGNPDLVREQHKTY